MSAIINGSIRVDRLPKEKFIKGKRWCGVLQFHNSGTR